MMRSIIEWSMRFRLLVIALAVATMVVGLSQLRSMPVDALPEFAPPYVEVQTEALGLSAPEVDRKSTRLNSSHANISYAVFCLKKKKKKQHTLRRNKTKLLRLLRSDM